LHLKRHHRLIPYYEIIDKWTIIAALSSLSVRLLS
jgi:hypothetical protein